MDTIALNALRRIASRTSNASIALSTHPTFSLSVLGGSIYNGNRLQIKSVNKQDRGTYYCFAENGVGRGDRRNVNLEIEFSPVITVPRPKVGQALNYAADLECHVEAYPPPQIIWVKEEFLLSNSKNYKISNFASAEEFTDSTLRIVSLQGKQTGDYKCKAVNKLGQDEGTIHLHETSSPVCPPACGQGYSSGNALQLSSFLALVTIAAVCRSVR
jgi:neuronal growth regulator 1